MQKKILFLFCVFLVMPSLFSQPTKTPVSARLATNTFSWSYEAGNYIELPAVRYYDQFFDSIGRLIKTIEYYDATNIYRTIDYDFSKYSLPTQKWKDAKGAVIGYAEVKIEAGLLTEYLYDKDGKVLYITSIISSSGETSRMVRKRQDGTIEWILDIIYDEDGEIVKKTMRNPDGNAVAFLSYQYTKDEYGNWISRIERMSVYGVYQWPKEIVHRELKY